ncbi:uncharacterized protein G2W53_033331 [Senna tora]|uniref:Uncharacterized protein n=1 Tax=Senna tora TaxID=362788 RepID=A0A834T0E5_9FABA|nr:uncharacterized protein G2W53_033331 [Senna tora]
MDESGSHTPISFDAGGPRRRSRFSVFSGLFDTIFREKGCVRWV